MRTLALVALSSVAAATSALAQGFDGRPPQTRHPAPWGIGRPQLVQAMGATDFRPSLTVHGYNVGEGQVAFSFHHGSVESVAEIPAAPTRDLRLARSQYETYKRAVGWHYGTPLTVDVPVSGELGLSGRGPAENLQTTWRALDPRPDGVHAVEVLLSVVPEEDRAPGQGPAYVVVVRYDGPEVPPTADD